MPKKFNSLLEAVRNCDNIDQQSLFSSQTDQYSFYIDSVLVGVLSKHAVPALQEYTVENQKLFFFDEQEKKASIGSWCLTRAQRQECFAVMLEMFRVEQVWPCLKNWRTEQYPIYGNKNSSDGVFFTIERAAAEAFGIRTFGVHVNGFVKLSCQSNEGSKAKTIKMWIAKRSLFKGTFPGMLDQVVAGGISAGEGPLSSVIRECEEEAGIPKQFSERAVPAGAIQYITHNAHGIQPETQYVYDLELPSSFQPKAVDGEVDCFMLLEIDKVLEKLFEGVFKPNCLCVIVDFLIRHGIITPENEPDYLYIIDSLHRTLVFPGPKSHLPSTSFNHK
ncbi:hypothetical protein BB561_000813 [Smittium simulii]|uniref:Nudix hydrolase domain-containing protein n=1 Tax=Smittium simulii TaxID=133385 RepID=A0A2T9YXI9_9FUNG|nr:hypothetical protein BB561_000813 [Smittium simulii]